MRTRAAILSKVSDPPVIGDVEIGEPQFGEVRVQVVASGVCHTDVSVMHGLLPVPLPAILGHEGAGIVQAVGPGGHEAQRGGSRGHGRRPALRWRRGPPQWTWAPAEEHPGQPPRE